MRLFSYILIFVFAACSSAYAMEDSKNDKRASQENIAPQPELCAICQDPLLPAQVKSSCKNMHAIHRSCAIDLMASTLGEGKTVTCPLCRVECEQEFENSLVRPQLSFLLKQLKEKAKAVMDERDILHSENQLLHREEQENLGIEQLNRQIDNQFNNKILDHTKKRMALHAWRQQEQTKLNSYSRSLFGFSLLAATINYVSPFWTSFVVNGTAKNVDVEGLVYWATARNVFTQFPLYMIGKSFLDYKQYKLNIQEVDKRLARAREWGFGDIVDVLEMFKKTYKEKVIADQVIFPLFAMGTGVAIPFVCNKLQAQSLITNIKSDVQWSVGLCLLGGYIVEQTIAHRNQQWFDNNMPKFGNGYRTQFQVPNGQVAVRNHIFPDDVPQ